MLIYPLAFIITLGVLVTFHELGHYVVARLSGVRILKFSVGFGRPLWSRVDRRGTEFAIGALPLGGYVRMLDGRDGAANVEVAPDDVDFRDLSVWWRLAIVLAGPLANFALAALFHAAIALAGAPMPVPMVGQTDPDSPVGRAGMPSYQQVFAIDGQEVRSWQEAVMALSERLGETGAIAIAVGDPGSERVREVEVPVANWLQDAIDPSLLDALGLEPETLAVVGKVEPGTPAERAGLQPWDRIAAIDGEPISTWSEMADAVGAAPNRPLRLTVLRGGDERLINITPERHADPEGEVRGRLGVRSPTTEVSLGPAQALLRGIEATGEMTLLTLDHMGKLIFGEMSPRNLGGPIAIAKVAGDSAAVGWQAYVSVLALLSVSLAVLNLLPIPMLDGGHALYCLAEIVTRRPVSERVEAVGGQLGMVLLGGLMAFVFLNDVMRLI